MLWLLFLLVGTSVIAYFVWDFRKKTVAREAASKRRFEELLREQASGSPAPAVAPAATPVSRAAPAAPAAAFAPAPAAVPVAAAVPAAAAAAVRERFLGQHETLLYLLLKTGLPDHEIFANVSLASVMALPASGGEREQQVRHLAPYQLDFVVCDKSMHIVAAVDLETAGGAEAAGIQQFKADYLKRAGIRLVHVIPTAMPKRDQVRGLVVGGSAAPAAPNPPT